jgi:hypothetical protein
MTGQDLFERQWPYLLSFLPSQLDLDSTAQDWKALSRRREVSSGNTLLRLALAYGFCGLSLRQTTAWAEAAGVASLSNVALLKRLRAASDWLGFILGLKLADLAPPPPSSGSLRIRLVDATTISQPGSTGTDWRIHLGFDLHSLGIRSIELTDFSGGETLTRFPLSPGEIVVGDRGYAHRKGLHSVRETGGHFLVRLNWQNIPLQTLEGSPFDILSALRTLPEAAAGDFLVRVAPLPRDNLPPLPARLVAIRKTEAAATRARQEVLRESHRKRHSVDPRTLEAAAYVFVLTSLPSDSLAPAAVLDLYRFRWQIEMAFKRLKGLLFLDHLPTRDPPLARSFLYAKLIAALLLDDFTEKYLGFSPWGFRFP